MKEKMNKKLFYFYFFLAFQFVPFHATPSVKLACHKGRKRKSKRKREKRESHIKDERKNE